MSAELLEAIEQFESKGGVVVCDGQKVSVNYPPDRKSELEPILATLRANRDQVGELVRELRQEGVGGAPPCPPLPAGVKLIRYKPKSAPVAIAPVSIVTDVRKFIDFNLAELDARLRRPVRTPGAGTVYELMAKLAEVGVELELVVSRQPGKQSHHDRG